MSSIKSQTPDQKLSLEGKDLDFSRINSDASTLHVDKPAHEEQTICETSWAALSQIIVAFFLSFNIWGLVYSFGVYQTYYSRSNNFVSNNSEISWIGSLQASLAFVGLIATGPLFDRGYARWLLAIGIVLNVLGMMMASIALTYWQVMLSQGLCVGLGYAMLLVVAIGQIAVTFKTYRWSAFGLAQCGGALGAIVYNEMFRTLQPSIGAAWTTRIIAFTMLGTLLISAALLRPRVLSQPRTMFDADAFHNGPFLTFCLASCIGFMGLFIPFFYLQEYAIEHPLITSQDPNLAPSLITVLNAGAIIGRTVPGFIADRLGLINTYTASWAGTALMTFLWLACPNANSVIAFALFYGIFASCAGALQSAVLASLAPAPNLVGTWLGMGSFATAIGLLLGSPLGGIVLARYGWLALQLWSASLIIACFFTTIATRVLRGGWGVRVHV